jgi:hypothetical protein
MEIIRITTMMETASIIILLVTFFIIRFFLRKRKKKPVLETPGTESIIAKAIVLSVEQATTTINSHARMKILVQVMPEKGRNFVIELKETLSATELSVIRTGSTVSVKYNPSNTKEVSLIKAA